MMFQRFSLTEEHVNTILPITGPARMRQIVLFENLWKSLPIRTTHSKYDVDIAAKLLSAIAFSDYTIPITTPHHTPHHPIHPSTRVAAVHQHSDYQWFLATVVNYHSPHYLVRDDDDEDERVKEYKLSESSVRPLPCANQELQPGEKVLAVFPDSTTFYPATVLHRKATNWLLRFDDDDDDGHDEGRVVDPIFIFNSLSAASMQAHVDNVQVCSHAR